MPNYDELRARGFELATFVKRIKLGQILFESMRSGGANRRITRFAMEPRHFVYKTELKLRAADFARAAVY